MIQWEERFLTTMSWIVVFDCVFMFALSLLIFNRLTRKQVADLAAYLAVRIAVLLLLVTINLETLVRAAAQIGWFSTTILGFACLYLGWFCIASFPGVFYYWATDKKPKYIPPPREKNPPPES